MSSSNFHNLTPKGYIFPQKADDLDRVGQRGRAGFVDPVDIPQVLFFRNMRKNRTCVTYQCQRTIAVQAKTVLMLRAVSSTLRNITEIQPEEGQDIAA